MTEVDSEDGQVIHVRDVRGPEECSVTTEHEDELDTLARAVTIIDRIADTGLHTTTTTTGKDPE